MTIEDGKPNYIEIPCPWCGEKKVQEFFGAEGYFLCTNPKCCTLMSKRDMMLRHTARQRKDYE